MTETVLISLAVLVWAVYSAYVIYRLGEGKTNVLRIYLPATYFVLPAVIATIATLF